MSSPRPKFVIFDGNALLHRAYHALPPLTTADGRLVNAVYGFTSIFLKVLKELKPAYVAVTFDRKEPTFRHQEFKEYKAQRIKKPQELYDQIPLIKSVVAAFQLPILEAKGFEADDIIGTLASLVAGQQPAVDCVIVTGDLDTLQLVDDHTTVYTLQRGLGDTVTYDEAAVEARYGLKPNQLIDFKALRGDPSDNIPGVHGIGEKTALELLTVFGTLDAMYRALKKGDAKLKKFSPKLIELLKTSQAEAELSKRLVTIVRDVPLDFSLAGAALKTFDMDALVGLFHELGFKSLLPRLPELSQKLGLPQPATTKPTSMSASGSYHLVSDTAKLTSVVAQLKEAGSFTFDTETTSLEPWSGKLVGISLSVKPGEAYFVQASPELMKSKTWQELAKVFADPTIPKCGHNLKFDIEVLHEAGIAVAGTLFDTLIAAHLARSGERVLDLKSLVFQELGVQMTAIEELIGKSGKGQRTMAEVPPDEVAKYACADADYTLQLAAKLKPELEQQKLGALFHDIEMPLVPVLAELERAGVKVDVGYLNGLEHELAGELVRLEKKIHKLAGREFNINSPKQLKEVLFDELNISPEGLRHTKTGVSTAASELEKMKGLHPIIDELFSWREFSKLQSTYVEAIPALVNKETGRLHTSFNQTVAATGRLSSSDPNLQNIPVRGDWGKRLRQAFIADKGNVLLSCDYSQIELRIVAHLAHDKRMAEVFTKGDDIHTSTAAFIFGVKPGEVTPDQRRSAKEVNFGILYGMGAWGLAERTGISRDEAQDFIARYFKVFSGVATWIEATKVNTKRDGYASTMFGRRRSLPEINSGMAQVRAAAERMAINLPVQGTAADMMKMAMIIVARELPSVSATARMTLQVHDELVFEVPQGEAQAAARLVKREMENAVKLSVPVVVDAKVGKNWGEMEKLTIAP